MQTQTNQADRAQSYPPLETVTAPVVCTSQAAYYLRRSDQTLRYWAAYETYPDGLKPIRLTNRLAWPVEGIRKRVLKGPHHA